MRGHRLTNETIETEEALAALLGEPTALVRAKVSDRLNALTRQFIERAPFVLLATADDEGRCDVSPRGDPAGFVRILDDATLLIPERPGNRLADSLRNIVRNPRVGLLFIVPGVGETLRVNGRATLVTDRALLQPCAVEGKTPRLGIVVDVESAFTHCSKAFLRSQLWDPRFFVKREELPSNGAIMKLLHEARGGGGGGGGDGDFDAGAYDAERAARYARREGFY
jgi:hypothetical protein